MVELDLMILIVWATVENPRGSVEKLGPQDSPLGAYTFLWGSVRAPEGFSSGKPSAAKPRGLRRLNFTASGLRRFIVEASP